MLMTGREAPFWWLNEYIEEIIVDKIKVVLEFPETND